MPTWKTSETGAYRPGYWLVRSAAAVALSGHETWVYVSTSPDCHGSANAGPGLARSPARASSARQPACFLRRHAAPKDASAAARSARLDGSGTAVPAPATVPITPSEKLSKQEDGKEKASQTALPSAKFALSL